MASKTLKQHVRNIGPPASQESVTYACDFPRLYIVNLDLGILPGNAEQRSATLRVLRPRAAAIHRVLLSSEEPRSVGSGLRHHGHPPPTHIVVSNHENYLAGIRAVLLF